MSASDIRTPVDDSYDVPFSFTGAIDKLTFKLGPSQIKEADKPAVDEGHEEDQQLTSAMRPLLILTALLEAVTGLALLLAPAVVAFLLLGQEIAGPAIPLGRVAGAALLALGIACWLGADDCRRTASGLIPAMLTYNACVAAILAIFGGGAPAAPLLLWLAVIVHVAMGVWCVGVIVGARRGGG